MNSPQFSVIIPALNEEKFLPKLLDSLSVQTRRDFEVIVVDGSSKDKTVAVAQQYKDKLPSLNVVVSKKANLPLQRNLGANVATGEWLVFIDADSVLLPYFFDRITSYISETNSEFFTTWFKPDSDLATDSLYTLVGNMFIESSLVFHRPIAPGPLSIVARRVYELVDGYDETVSWGEDYDFTKRVTEQGIPFTICRETLYVFSLRRLRNEGKLKFLNTYVKSSLLVLLTKKNFRHMPGYIMGGHLYTEKKKRIRASTLRKYEVKFRKLMKELFE